MKYSRGITRKVEKYFNKYFCKYKSKTRFNRFEYSAVKRMVIRNGISIMTIHLKILIKENSSMIG